MAFRTLFFKSLVAYIFGPKNLPKTIQNRAQNDEKIESKNDAFFDLHFFTFWPDFGGFWG